ncbi:benzoate 4-monooxygenase cytochrome P450 [Hypomontagnella submonticulosa]|nr:benzoate 4-monooxygenase cytochrome P450 [Hypomontagnella submonticulosa]
MELFQGQTALTELFWFGILSFILIIVYNLYFHPLCKIPGPWTAAVSEIPYCLWYLGGRQSFKIAELHDKYGHAVRIAPNEVSFNTAQSWKDIYGQRPGHQPFLKGAFYRGASFASKGFTSIVSEARPEVHREMRSYLSGAFSDRAILEQEDLVAKSIDKFIRLLDIRGSGENGVDMSTMFESMTFDIAGDLAFGEAFGALDGDKRHPWISTVLDGLPGMVIADISNRSPLMGKALQIFKRADIESSTADADFNEEQCYEAVKRRISKETDRKDFLTRILQDRDPKVVSDMQIAAHSSDLMVAGSDTTASGLIAIVYYLLQFPSTMTKLTAEIREAFDQYSQINHASTIPLQYLRAVILEALRIYPPVSIGMPRVVPEGGDTVDGYFLPGGVTVGTNHLAASISPQNFQDPLSFKPERWLDPNTEDILESSQPWLLGTRGCIGRNLAWLELRTAIAKLVWTYDLQLVDPTLDLYKESEVLTALWKRPTVMVRVKNRGDTID